MKEYSLPLGKNNSKKSSVLLYYKPLLMIFLEMAFSDPLFPRILRTIMIILSPLNSSVNSRKRSLPVEIWKVCVMIDIPFHFIFFIRSSAVSTTSRIVCQLLGLLNFSSKQLL